MAKTVFGVPGSGQNSQGGDAVAPGGVPGAGAQGGIAQKGGKTEAFAPMKSPTQSAPKPAAPAAAPTAAAPKAAPIPAAKPVMAKPIAPGTAAPVASAGSANRTMFGMPAMKKAVSDRPPDKFEPALESSIPTPRPAPPAPSVAEPPDAFMPTQLGMAPVSPAEIAAATSHATAKVPTPAPATTPSPAMHAPAAAAPSSIRMPMNEDESFNTGPSKGMLVAIIAGVAVLFIVAMLAAFFFFIKPRMFPAFDPATLPTEVQPAAPSSLAPPPAQ